MCFESICIFQKMAAILNFGGHFRTYINYYKFEIFLMPNKTFVDIFFAWNCFMLMFKKVFLNPIAAILELAAISRHCWLKTKNQRWKHTRHYWVHKDRGFSPCCLLLTKKFRGVPIEAEIWDVPLDYKANKKKTIMKPETSFVEMC